MPNFMKNRPTGVCVYVILIYLFEFDVIDVACCQGSEEGNGFRSLKKMGGVCPKYATHIFQMRKFRFLPLWCRFPAEAVFFFGTTSRPGCKGANRTHPCGAEVKNAWRYTASPQFACMAWCLIKYHGQLTFIQS
jgi:hypothetical protein